MLKRSFRPNALLRRVIGLGGVCPLGSHCLESVIIPNIAKRWYTLCTYLGPRCVRIGKGDVDFEMEMSFQQNREEGAHI